MIRLARKDHLAAVELRLDFHQSPAHTGEFVVDSINPIFYAPEPLLDAEDTPAFRSNPHKIAPNNGSVPTKTLMAGLSNYN